MREDFLYIFLSHTDFFPKILILLVIHTDFVLDQSGRSVKKNNILILPMFKFSVQLYDFSVLGSESSGYWSGHRRAVSEPHHVQAVSEERSHAVLPD